MQMWNFVTWKPGHPSRETGSIDRRRKCTKRESVFFFRIFFDWCAARKKILTMRRLWEKLSVNHRHIILELFCFLMAGWCGTCQPTVTHIAISSGDRGTGICHGCWICRRLLMHPVGWKYKRTESICKRVRTPLGFSQSGYLWCKRATIPKSLIFSFSYDIWINCFPQLNRKLSNWNLKKY